MAFGLKNWVCWNAACAIKLIWLLFFKRDSIWASWYLTEVLDGNINNFWVINTKQKNSWLANYSLLQRDTVFDWIKMAVGNGETCYFWSSNWSPFGNITKYLRGETSRNTGIPSTVVLAELWELGRSTLPPARSDAQVEIQSFLSTLELTNVADGFLWMPGGTASKAYSTKAVYNLLRVRHQRVPWYKEIWFTNGIPRHKFLAWLFVLTDARRRTEWLSGDLILTLCVFYATQALNRETTYTTLALTLGRYGTLLLLGRGSLLRGIGTQSSLP